MGALFLAYLRARLGEPTSITALAGAVAATIAYLSGHLAFDLFAAAIGAALTAFLAPERKSTAAVLLILLILAVLAGCALTQDQQQSLGAAGIDLARAIAPKAASKYDDFCQRAQPALTALASADQSIPQVAAAVNNVGNGACTEEGKAQMAANDAAPVTPANSGDSVGWGTSALNDALIAAKIAGVIVR